MNATCRPSEFPMNSSPTFHFRLLGTPSIEGEGGTPLTGRVVQRHRVALLAVLAMAPGRRSSRDKVLGLLWPESGQERGRNLLNVATYVLRTALGESAILSEGDDLRLNADVVRTDVAEFETAILEGDNARVAALYRGPFLDGFFLSDAPEFEQWVSRERERLAGDHRKAQEALAEAAEARGDFSTAASLWKSRAAQDLYDSRVAARLMLALEASGNRAGALQHGSIHQRLLQDEFGVASPEVTALAERLRSAPAPETHGVSRRPAPTAPALPASLPQPPVATAEVRQRRPWVGRAVVAALASVLLASAVWSLWPTGDQPERSIAVLPFIDLGPASDSGAESFGDGLTEEIIAGLSGVPELKVISRTSAMHYKGSKKPLPQIAEELGVAHILEGSVRQSGSRLRITVQLIDARADKHLWAQNFDDDMGDILRVQEQIAREVVRALEVELGERGQMVLVRRGTRDAEAYQLYRRARYLWNTRTREGHARAAQLYSQAIERDSGYADAYAGLAATYLTAFQLNVSSLPPAEGYSRAKWAVERALALDDKSADAYSTYGISLLWQHNVPAAQRAIRRALQLNPSLATAHSWNSLLLSGLGRPREALEESRRAYELDPFSVVQISTYGWQCYLSRDIACAIEQHRRTIEIAPTYGRGHQRLALAFVQNGMLPDALAALHKAIELNPERTDFVADLAYVQALRGETAAALATLEQAKREPFEPFSVGRAYVALRQPDSAFAWLERSNWQWTHRADRRDPALDPLRSDPRFARLTARIDRDMGIR